MLISVVTRRERSGVILKHVFKLRRDVRRCCRIFRCIRQSWVCFEARYLECHAIIYLVAWQIAERPINNSSFGMFFFSFSFLPLLVTNTFGTRLVHFLPFLIVFFRIPKLRVVFLSQTRECILFFFLYRAIESSLSVSADSPENVLCFIIHFLIFS